MKFCSLHGCVKYLALFVCARKAITFVRKQKPISINRNLCKAVAPAGLHDAGQKKKSKTSRWQLIAATFGLCDVDRQMVTMFADRDGVEAVRFYEPFFWGTVATRVPNQMQRISSDLWRTISYEYYTETAENGGLRIDARKWTHRCWVVKL